MASNGALPTITPEQIAEHTDIKSCYVTIGSKVYDVTPFLTDHPGGEDLILDYAGKDITTILEDEVSHKHSESAYEILDDYHIGFLPKDYRPAAVGGKLPPSPPGSPSGRAQTIIRSEEELKFDTDLVSDYKENKFLDLTRPMFPQMLFSNFSKEFYLEQVHKPRHYKGGASAPLFGNFLEPLSKTPWWLVPILWFPWVGYGLYKANEGLSPGRTASWWVFGCCLWSLLEYGLHRCLFHVDENMPDHPVFLTMHFLLHGIHHYLPMDRYRLVMPPVLFFVLAVPFWYLAHAVFYFNWHLGTATFCGGITGYICYDLTHYFLHHKNLPAYYRELKKYHLQHHFTDFQKGFGVTSKFWDKVFGTELIYNNAPIKKTN